MKARDIMSILNRLAPEFLIDSWDNSGLQVGSTEENVEKILISVDLSKDSLKKAIEEKVHMIITHHPFIFGKLSNISLDDERGKMIRDIIKNDITVFSMHTNLDMCKGGVNDELCKLLGIESEKPLSKFLTDRLYKISVFVPKSHSDKVRDALGESGAGFIGDYSNCSFSSEGIGRFLPIEGANPFIGTKGKIEEVEEEKIETIVDEHKLQSVIDQMIKVHPYEEVAYDIYPLKNTGHTYGYGRLGHLSEEMTLKEFARLVNEKLECRDLRIYGDLEQKIKKIAVCGGSGSAFIKDASRQGADAYVTGDIRYHDAQLAKELGITILDAGHYETEQASVELLKDYINKNTKNLEIITYKESLAKFTTLN